MPHQTTPHAGLTGRLGEPAVTALVIGEVIAVGIFLTPAGMARPLGSPLWLLIVWLAMGAMALSGASCYGELAARFPEALRPPADRPTFEVEIVPAELPDGCISHAVSMAWRFLAHTRRHPHGDPAAAALSIIRR
jgi:hypothetical protein